MISSDQRVVSGSGVNHFCAKAAESPYVTPSGFLLLPSRVEMTRSRDIAFHSLGPRVTVESTLSS